MEAPCPDKIWQDAGGAFAIGYVLMGVINIGVGIKRGPPRKRVLYTYALLRKRSPKFGGNFAIWGSLFSGFDCTLSYIRKTEDTVNPIAAGALTGGILAARSGWRHSVQAAAFGGIFIGIIEAFQHMMQKKMQQQQEEANQHHIEERKRYDEERKQRELERKKLNDNKSTKKNKNENDNELD
ncbi:hypothetical protein RB653_008215 [Dictyostelium firmibasis]|uniref:Mitochondrial import inner membrane translocase subunit TIM17 n=1 Tax=Dictyostelium firmibasis TaxID=79012 RepID=A0AAN7TZQ7_9MYCE